MNGLNHIRCQSAEQLQEALGHIWDVEVTQSDPGPIEMVLTSAQVGDCLVYGSGSNRSLLCSGTRSDAYWTISPITRHCGGGRFRGQQLDEGQILVLDPRGEVYQQIAAGHRQQAISIPLDLAERIAQAEHQTSAEAMWERWCLKSDPRVADQMARMLEQLLSEPRSPGPETDPDAGMELAGKMIALIQNARQVRPARSSLAQRRRIVRRAEALIRSRLDNPPSVTELCEATHASRRLLFYAFSELLGRSPAGHAKILRLHAARRGILARSSERCVQQIGFDLGFWHPGQFAIDYAKLFGESPSMTRLRNNRTG
ncbi:helix-turn-helix domain-containing protein [Thioalkalivibrio sp.]|uniref:helix-turn-helix domain-containing protein n=1 Tax=Thioalkalivibrio sp. TaxID=2093813 RepID=UPI003974D802